MADITRRDFLKIAFGTVLSGLNRVYVWPKNCRYRDRSSTIEPMQITCLTF
ncbi:MAG: hypothetical protein H6961_01330 [Chromatiaceae bacterium]|nr:hypothetical protein [Chromatiaceae bacterium]HPE79631.1 hypothetical protein [Gammaproteobacteria bacterium]